MSNSKKPMTCLPVSENCHGPFLVPFPKKNAVGCALLGGRTRTPRTCICIRSGVLQMGCSEEWERVEDLPRPDLRRRIGMQRLILVSNGPVSPLKDKSLIGRCVTLGRRFGLWRDCGISGLLSKRRWWLSRSNCWVNWVGQYFRRHWSHGERGSGPRRVAVGWNSLRWTSLRDGRWVPRHLWSPGSCPGQSCVFIRLHFAVGH